MDKNTEFIRVYLWLKTCFTEYVRENSMKANIIQIGNSLGIRIPRVLLKLCGITKEVDLAVKRTAIVIKPKARKPREDWDKAFKQMHENKDDQLVIPDTFDIDMENWEW